MKSKYTTTEIIGRRFNRLVVQSYFGIGKYGDHSWNCLCDCGNMKVVASTHLANNRVKSCGCLPAILGRDVALAGNTAVKVTHGQSKTRTYRIWLSMKRRCNQTGITPNGYKSEGIAVCEEWRDSFLVFYGDMGECPSDGHSIDRIDSRGNYEPSNCRWATDLEQAKNKSNNRFIEHNGERHHLAEWSRITGISSPTLRLRLEHGWNVSDALTRPVR